MSVCAAAVIRKKRPLRFVTAGSLLGVAAGLLGSRLPSSFLPDEESGPMFTSTWTFRTRLLRLETHQCSGQSGLRQMLANTPGGANTRPAVCRLQLAQLCVRTSYNAFFFRDLEALEQAAKQEEEQYQEIKQRFEPAAQQTAAGKPRSASRRRQSRESALPADFSFVPRRNRAGRDVPFLTANLDKFLAAARKATRNWLHQQQLFCRGVPQKFLEVNREKVLKQGVAIGDVYQTIQTFMGGLFINYFNDFGRTWQVYVEAGKRLIPIEYGESRSILRAQQRG